MQRFFEFIHSSILSSPKKLISSIFVLILLLAVPITIQLVGQQQDLRQRASGGCDASNVGQPCGTGGICYQTVQSNNPSYNRYECIVLPTPQPTVDPSTICNYYPQLQNGVQCNCSEDCISGYCAPYSGGVISTASFCQPAPPLHSPTPTPTRAPSSTPSPTPIPYSCGNCTETCQRLTSTTNSCTLQCRDNSSSPFRTISTYTKNRYTGKVSSSASCYYLKDPSNPTATYGCSSCAVPTLTPTITPTLTPSPTVNPCFRSSNRPNGCDCKSGETNYDQLCQSGYCDGDGRCANPPQATATPTTVPPTTTPTTVPLACDPVKDGVPDVNDYNRFVTELRNSTSLDSDCNDNGEIDVYDYTIWLGILRNHDNS